MNTKTKSTNQTGIEEAIDTVLFEMKAHDANSPEYAKMVEQLVKLNEIKQSDKTAPLISFDKMLPVIGNLAGIVAILGYERAHVVATKALGFVVKSKI